MDLVWTVGNHTECDICGSDPKPHLKVRLSAFFLHVFFCTAGNMSGGAEPVAMLNASASSTHAVIDVQLATAANNAEKVGGDCLR